MANKNIFTVGGTVQAGSGIYIPRQADNELLNLCQQGDFAYVLTSRQMGKSSLMVRTAEQLSGDGITSAIIDLNQLGVQVTAEAWYLGLLTTIEDALLLETDTVDWWQSQATLGLTQRLTLFFRDVLLPQIAGQIVIFVDEIDSTLSLTFTDDFFAAIRYLYNGRAILPDLQRLSFVLIGVATPSDLMDDPKRTPFNIGQRVDLSDFTFSEARPFAEGFGLRRNESLQLLAWALKWTNGHPYLTQRLCQVLAERPPQEWSETAADDIVARTFLGDMAEKDHNLQFVRDMLTKRAPDMAGVLSAYRAICQGLYGVPDEEQSPLMAHLKLSGIVRRPPGQNILKVRNLIYATVFDVAWVENEQQKAEVSDPREMARLRALADEQELRVEAERRRAEEQEHRANAERRRAEAEQHQATLERRRAEEQTQAAAQLRRRAIWLGLTSILAILAVIVAVGFGVQAQNSAAVAQTAQAQAQVEATLAAYARQTAEVGATQESLARNDAVAAQSTAQIQATLAAYAKETAEAGAIQESLARGEAVAAQGTAQLRATQEAQAKQTAQAGAVQEALARGEAVAAQGTAEYRTTLEAVARATAQAESTRAINAEATAQAEATLVNQARSTAQHEANRARDAEDKAHDERSTAEAESTRAIQAEQTAQANRVIAEAESTRAIQAEQTAQANQSTAEAGATQEAIAKATAIAAEATAQAERDRADQLARLSTSRQLALQALNVLQDEYDLALLLALEANRIANTVEAKSSLLQSLEYNPALITVLREHPNGVESVAFNADNTLLASASDDLTIILWDMSDRYHPQPLALPLSGHTDKVRSVAFNPQGTLLASGSDDRTVRLWDVVNGTPLASPLSGHTDQIWHVTFSPDGTMLASSGLDDKVILWDVSNPQNPQQRHVLVNESQTWVYQAVFSPDGNTLAAGSFNPFTVQRTLVLWDLSDPANPQVKQRLSENFKAPIISLAFSPDGQTLASGSCRQLDSQDFRRCLQGELYLWDVDSGQRVGPDLLEHSDWVSTLAFTPNGDRLASAGYEGDIILWDVTEREQPTEVERFEDHLGQIWSVTFSSDGNTLASSGFDSTIRLRDISTRRPDIRQRLGQALQGHENRVYSLAYSPDSQTFASGSDTGQIILWDAVSRQSVSEMSNAHSSFVNSLAFSPDNKTLASGSFDGSMRLWNVSERSNVQPWGNPLSAGGPILSVAFNPSGTILASASDSGLVMLWDVSDPGNPQTLGTPLSAHTGFVNSVIFSPDGQTLATAGATAGGMGSIILWDISNPQAPQQLIAPLNHHLTPVRTLAFNPNGQQLASGSEDRSIIMWDITDLTNPQPLGDPLSTHTNFITSLAYSPDGLTLASAGFDRVLILWDVTTRRRLGEPLSGHVDFINSLVFSPDGQSVLTGSWDHTLFWWDVDFISWQNRACRIANRNLTQSEIDLFIPIEFQSNTPTCPDLTFPFPASTMISSPLVGLAAMSAVEKFSPGSTPASTATTTPVPVATEVIVLTPTPTPSPTVTATTTPTPSYTATPTSLPPVP